MGAVLTSTVFVPPRRKLRAFTGGQDSRPLPDIRESRLQYFPAPLAVWPLGNGSPASQERGPGSPSRVVAELLCSASLSQHFIRIMLNVPILGPRHEAGCR